MSLLQTRPVLVTGCSGFIGANLAAGLAAQGRRVIGIDGPSGVDWRWRALPRVERQRLDVRSESDVRAFVHEVQPLAVFNCAAYGAYSVQTDPRRMYEVNVLAVRHLLDAVRHVPGFRAFVQAGSSSEYGYNCAAPGEDAPTEPDSDYAISKVAAAGMVRLFAKKHGVPGFVLRLYSVYGPFEDFSRLIPRLLENARANRFPQLVSPNISRDFLYVADVVAAFAATLERAPALEPGEIFNIGTGVCTTLGSLVEVVRELFAVQAEPAWGSMPERSWDHSTWYANPAKARASLNWEATTTLAEGLAAARRWLEHNLDLVAEGQAKTVLKVAR